MTSLLDFPDLASKTLLKYLPPRDILKLRRVCSTTKAWVAGYIPPICLLNDIAENIPERRYIGVFGKLSRWQDIGGSGVLIDGAKYTFDTLASLGWRISEIKICNDFDNSPAVEGQDQSKEGPKVRDVYAASPGFDMCVIRTFPFIRMVDVTHFNACPFPQEWAFFCSLTSMDELHITTAWVEELPTEERPIRFPPTFKNLRFLKVFQIRMNKEIMDECDAVRTYHWDLMRFCSKTHNILRPLMIFNNEPDVFYDEKAPWDSPYYEEGVIGCLKQIVIERTDQRYPVRIIDMECIIDDNPIGTTIRKYFTTLITFCGKRNIKLINVYSHLFQIYNPFDLGFEPPEPEPVTNADAARFIQASIRSLCNFTNFINPQLFLGLESIRINSMLPCYAYAEIRGMPLDTTAFTHPPPAFPNLKQIWIRLDVDTQSYAPNKWEHFLRSLLSIPRPNVYILVIIFVRGTPGLEGGGDVVAPRTLTAPRFLRPVWLANNFVSVTKLVISGWDAKNIHFIQIWKGLTQLRDLHLEDCRTLGNVGFIGEDPEDPVFLMLKGLKVIILDLTDMPKITDRVFKDVFSKMAIKRFVIRSKMKPLENITPDAIRALADPESLFAKSIQRFPIQFSLAGTSNSELYELMKLFRLYQ